MRQEHNKLVRDRIPEIISKSGIEYQTITLSEQEYQQALRQKLIEEAQEAATANNADLAIEIADLLDIDSDDIIRYGNDKAKLSTKAVNSLSKKENGKLKLTSAMQELIENILFNYIK